MKERRCSLVAPPGAEERIARKGALGGYWPNFCEEPGVSAGASRRQATLEGGCAKPSMAAQWVNPSQDSEIASPASSCHLSSAHCRRFAFAHCNSSITTRSVHHIYKPNCSVGCFLPPLLSAGIATFVLLSTTFVTYLTKSSRPPHLGALDATTEVANHYFC